MEQIDFGRQYIQLKKPVKMRLDVRSMIITAIFLVAIMILGIFSLTTGNMKLSVSEVFSALLGHAEGINRTVVVDWRLPRVLAAIVFGAGLAVSGSIFQTITRNPLGTPDILGLTSGSYTGALVVMLLVNSMSFTAITAGALIGGFLTAFIVYLLAFRDGIQGFRLMIVGVSISTILSSFNSMLLIRAQSEMAITAGAWGVGSLNGISWTYALPAIVMVLVLLIIVALMNRPLRKLALGRDLAQSHGLPFERTQFSLMMIAVMLSAVTTAVVGPVTFLALAAPQIAFRLTRTTESFVPTATIGAFILLSADVVAQRVFPGVMLPVGVVTLTLGGMYLIGLFVYQARSS